MIRWFSVRLLFYILVPFFAAVEHLAAAEPCSQVIIRAEIKTKAASYFQKGAGVVYARTPESNDRQIVVPSHVVLGAQKVVAICGRQEIPVQIIGQSVTGDLAVGTVSRTQSSFLKPLFYSSGVGVNTKSYSEIQGEIRVPSGDIQGTVKTIPVAHFSTYIISFMNPIFDDHGGLLISSGVVPGMSGSVLMDGDFFAGIITKSFTNESLSAAVSSDEVLALIPSLEKGIDPYLNRGVYLTSELVENAREKKLSRMHRLHLKTASGWIEYRDMCESSHWSATSAWTAEGGGWGEGGGGWGEGSGSFQPINSLKNQLVQGLDIPTADEQKTGRQARPIAFYLAGKTNCAKEGVVNNVDGRRLVGIINYPDEIGFLQTLRINSVDDLMPLAKIYGQNLLPLINERGIFGDEPSSSPLTKLCDSEAFKRFKKLQGMGFEKLQIFPSAESTSKVQSVFFLEYLDKLSGSSPAEVQSELTCEQASEKLHFKTASKESLLSFDLDISSQFIRGFIKLGSCRMDLNQYRKDFWQAELSSADMDWGFDLGVTIKSHGIIQLMPRRISDRCLKGTDFDSSKVKLRGISWIIDQD